MSFDLTTKKIRKARLPLIRQHASLAVIENDKPHYDVYIIGGVYITPKNRNIECNVVNKYVS